MKKTGKKVKNLFENCKWTKIALKLAYDGQNYMGFEKCPTVHGEAIEDHLFKAMKKVKIINTDEPLDYSKAGRTDKGVSAAGQVIAFKARQQNLDIYKKALNGTLPQEIRILDVAEVEETFDARKDCKQREYHYFFLRKNMDI